MDFTTFLNTVAALFLMLAVGFSAGKLKIINSTASKNLSNVILTISQPALIINSLTKMEYSAENLTLGLKSILFGFAIHFLLGIIAFLACMRIKDINERKIIEFATVFGNCGFIGIPILESLFGPVGAFMASFFIVSFNILLWIWGIAILSRKRSDIKLTVKKAFINKGTVPSLIGFIIFLLPFDLPIFVNTGISYIASLCTPVSMLIIGALLATRTPKQIFGIGKVYYLSALKLVLIPCFVCVLMKLTGFNSTWILFGTAMVAMPSAAVVTMLTELYDITPGFSAQCVGTTSLFSIATLPAIMYLANFIATL